MRSKRSSRNIIAILAERERGEATSKVRRRHGVSSATFYKWKAKYGDLDVSEVRKPKALETENARLKELLADQMLDSEKGPWPKAA